MYKKLLLVSLAVIGITFYGCDKTLDDLGLTEGQIIAGLKEALGHGTDTAVVNLSATDGYFKDQIVKILLPPEAQPVYDRLSSIPLLDKIVDETILAINRAAEDAATEAKPIFINAITGITIEDGLGILHGEDTAATSYLRGKTYSELFQAFQPKIETALSKDLVLGISAEESYEKLINTYNSASLNGFLFAKIEQNSLSEHTTNRALKGVFHKVGEEEKLIREDPAHRVTELLKTVFAEQD